MYLDKNSLVAGYPASLVRKVFQDLGEHEGGVKYFCYRFKISKAKAAKLIKDLVEEGFLEQSKSSYKDEICYAATIKGRSLAMASFAPAIKRVTADIKIAELIARAKLINSSEDYLYRVKRIAVFGSYLTDKSRINDIDVDIILEKKYPPEIQKKKEETHVSIAIKKGKHFGSFLDRLFYAELQTRKYLKHRSRSLSMHYGDPVLKQTKYEVIFEAMD